MSSKSFAAGLSTQSLLLEPIDLNDPAILDDDAHLAEAYAFDGPTHLIQVELLVVEGNRSLFIPRGNDSVRHGYLLANEWSDGQNRCSNKWVLGSGRRATLFADFGAGVNRFIAYSDQVSEN